MEITIKFFEWFNNLGGESHHASEFYVHKTLNNIPLKFSSSLRNRAAEIKEQHNYKFNFKNR
jgi:hypothetical protein